MNILGFGYPLSKQVCGWPGGPCTPCLLNAWCRARPAGPGAALADFLDFLWEPSSLVLFCLLHRRSCSFVSCGPGVLACDEVGPCWELLGSCARPCLETSFPKGHNFPLAPMQNDSPCPCVPSPERLGLRMPYPLLGSMRTLSSVRPGPPLCSQHWPYNLHGAGRCSRNVLKE